MTASELRAARERLELSQAQLAALLSVDVMTISRWERGERAIPPHLHLAIAHLSCRPKRRTA